MKIKAVKYFFIASMLLSACCLYSQKERKHILKCDLSAFFNNGYGGTYEFRTTKKNGIELKGYFENYQTQEPDIFNGDWTVYYAERKTDTLHKYFNELLGTSGWNYITEGRPLPAVSSFVPHSTLQLSLGFRFSFEKNKSLWRIFIQPGCSLIGHRFYEISETIFVENNLENSWIAGSYPHEFRVKRRTMSYRQTRSMRLQSAWQLGLNYDLGLSRKFGKHFLLEGRLATGANLWLPYDEPQPPVPVRRFWMRPALLAGWAF